MKRSLSKAQFQNPRSKLSEMTAQLAIEEVCLLYKVGQVVNKEHMSNNFNIITNNEALPIDFELSNKQNLTLASIYCPYGNPNLTLFHTINNLSDNVMFVGHFSSKLVYFGCAKQNTSGPMLKNIQKHLNPIY